MTRSIVFVAGEVGGLGGMERQSEQLIAHLLDAGWGVTVIARSCELPQHERLEFVRVPTPRRPFTVAYPAFIAAASLLAARRRGAILHTTGAIVANRADVSTVHYCHRSARKELSGSRAARATVAHRLNALLADMMSRAVELWCYRPERTRLLCAVSSGMAAELRREFPRMADTIMTVPNGVDTERFRPNPVARRQARAKLGIADDAHVALFAGGDWERKGLRYAVSALGSAADWRLLVAGAGDPAPLMATASSSGTEDRLRFLGSVADMPALYAAVDAFVLPTSYEAFPLVALEAAASALPLLITRVNGVEEMLQEGRNGWFITRDGEDIARRLNELSADRQLAGAMADAARSIAASYTWEAMTQGYISLYAELALRTNGAA